MQQSRSVYLLTLFSITAFAVQVVAQPQAQDPRRSELPDLVAIQIEAESLKNEQLAVGNELLKAYPNSFNVLRVMGYVHSTHGNLEDMAECWIKCQQISPDRPDIHDQLGRYYLRSEQYNDAIRMWRKTLELDPNYSGVQLRMGVAFLELGKADEAIEVLGKQIRLTPKDAESHYQLGEGLFQKQEFEKAKRAYLAAIRLSPSHSKAVYGLVKTSARLGQTDEVQKFGAAFENLEAAASKADLEYRKNFDDLQQVRRDVAVTLVDAGRIYAADMRLGKALELWERAAKIDANNQFARNFAAKVYLSQRKPHEALRHLEQLTKIDPTNARYHEQVGMILASTGNIAAAEKSFRRVVTLEPRNAGNYRLLAKFYLNTKQKPQRAYDLARFAVRLDPVADSYFVLGWANAQSNRLPDARVALEKAIGMDPQNNVYKKLYDSLSNKSELDLDKK